GDVYGDDQHDLEVPDEGGGNEVAIRLVVDGSKQVHCPASEWIGGLVDEQLPVDREVIEVVSQQIPECDRHQRGNQPGDDVQQRLVEVADGTHGGRETGEEGPDQNDERDEDDHEQRGVSGGARLE